MTYDFSTRLDRLGTRMKQIHNNTLTYTRTGFPPITITNFTPEKIDVTEMAAAGLVLITDKAQDFVFDADKLAALNPPTPKASVDKIVWDGKTFEVFGIGDGQSDESQTYRYTISTRKSIRVHTKQTI